MGQVHRRQRRDGVRRHELPLRPSPEERFLRARPDLDIHVYYEGEHAFAGIVERVLSAPDFTSVFDAPIDGCQFIHPVHDQFTTGLALPRIRELDEVPSPYVTGLLDKFFGGRLTPLVETARGCPFTCNFCNAYHTYFTKVNHFSDDYVRDELNYIAERAAKAGIGHVTFADNNFGMLPRDATTAQVLHSLQQKYGWPGTITVWTGKNSKERVIAVTRLLGDSLSISMSVQSMDDAVLKNIGRDNIKLDDYRAIAADLRAQGRPQHAEVIMPLPGETMQSHIKGLNKLLDTDVSKVFSHTLQMLHGTPYRDEEGYRQAHGDVTKYRIVPLDFTQVDGKSIFDTEEVGVATDALSFEEYVEARRYLLVIDLCYNSGVFDPLKKYLNSVGVENSTWIQAVNNGSAALPPKPLEVFESFTKETQSELWDSEEELVRFYSEPENYQKLVNYEAGGHVLFKHRVWMLTGSVQDWVDAVFATAQELVLAKAASSDEAARRREMDALKSYVLCTVVDAITPEKFDEPVHMRFDYDFPAWLGAPAADLADFTATDPVDLRFSFDAHAVSVMRDGFQRYGTDIAGLVKMIQRISGISFTRSVSYDREEGMVPLTAGAPSMGFRARPGLHVALCAAPPKPGCPSRPKAQGTHIASKPTGVHHGDATPITTDLTQMPSRQAMANQTTTTSSEDIERLLKRVKVYQSFDLPGIRVRGQRPRTDARLEIMLANTDFDGKTVLDLGCSNGFFCYKLAQAGARTQGVDKNAEVLGVNQRIAEHFGWDATFQAADIDLGYVEALDHYDVILFYSVLHHIFNHTDKDQVEACRAIIHALSRKCDTLYFEIGQSGEPFGWSRKLGLMGAKPRTWILDNLFAGSEFTDVQVVEPPSFTQGRLQRFRRRIAEAYRRYTLSPRLGPKKLAVYLLYRVFVRDSRDTRYIFIARR